MHFVSRTGLPTFVGSCIPSSALLLLRGSPKSLCLPMARPYSDSPAVDERPRRPCARTLTCTQRDFAHSQTINTPFQHSGQPVSRIEKDVERDDIMNPDG